MTKKRANFELYEVPACVSPEGRPPIDKNTSWDTQEAGRNKNGGGGTGFVLLSVVRSTVLTRVLPL